MNGDGGFSAAAFFVAEDNDVRRLAYILLQQTHDVSFAPFPVSARNQTAVS